MAATNQMLQAGDTTFVYDANGNRVEKNNHAGKDIYSYGYDAMNRRTFKASRGQVQVSYLYDGLGSVLALASDNGAITDRYRYDAFGKFTKKLNSEENPEDVFNNTYTFTGRRFDAESGLYNFHFRQYDPGTGVWTTPDPIGVLGGLNLYSYAGNNPVNWVDLLGLDYGHATDDAGDGTHGESAYGGGTNNESDNDSVSLNTDKYGFLDSDTGLNVNDYD